MYKLVAVGINSSSKPFASLDKHYPVLSIKGRDQCVLIWWTSWPLADTDVCQVCVLLRVRDLRQNHHVTDEICGDEWSE
jgi:hypothetical protein